MADDGIEWKGAEVLDISGMTLKCGTFTGADGQPTSFTQDLLRKIFDKLNKPIPFYFTHGHGGEKVKIGYAHKFGFDKLNNKLLYKSFVFEDGVKEKIVLNDYDDTSAEVDFKTDELGVPIDATLTGIALVPNPAIPGTEITASAIHFSKQQKKGDNVTIKAFSSTKVGVEKLLLEKGFAPEEVTTFWGMLGDINKPEQEKLMNDAEAAKKEFESKLAEAQETIKLEKAKAKDFETKYNSLLTEKMTGIYEDVKKFGVTDPAKVVEGLPPEQAISVLTKMKENFATVKQPVTTPASLGTNPTPPDDAKAAYASVVEELGLGNEIAKLQMAQKKMQGLI